MVNVGAALPRPARYNGDRCDKGDLSDEKSVTLVTSSPTSLLKTVAAEPVLQTDLLIKT
jgi:hypothetical protein